MHVTYLHSLCGRGHQAFVTEAVPLELLHEEVVWSYRRQKGGSTPRTLIPVWTLPLSAISRVVWAWQDPLPTGLKRVGKNVQTLWRVELDRLHSMTHAHPPLVHFHTSPIITKKTRVLYRASCF